MDKESVENIKEIINNIPKLSENIINQRIIRDLDIININSNNNNSNRNKNEKSNENRIKMNDINDKFNKLIVYLVISKHYLSKKQYSEIVKYLKSSLNNVGIKEEYLTEINNILKKNESIINNIQLDENSKIFDEYFELYIELSEYCKKRNSSMNIKHWSELINILHTTNIFNISELKKISDNIINEIKCFYKDLATNTKYKDVWSRKYESSIVKPKNEWTIERYQKEINNYLKLSISKLKKEHIEWLTTNNDILLDDLSTLLDIIKLYIDNISIELNSLILDTGNVKEIYTTNPRILHNVNIKNDEMSNLIMNKNKESDLSILKSILNKIDKMEIGDTKINKWNEVNVSIFSTLEEILESNISSEEKQISMEKAIIEYDINFFKNNLDRLDNEIKVITKEYNNISLNYDSLINDYTHNKSLIIKKMLKSKKEDDLIDVIIILIIISMGKDKVISIIFKQVIDKLLFNYQDIEGINKTNLLFNLAKYYTKIFNLNGKNNKLDIPNSIKEIITSDFLLDNIKNFKDIEYIKLGGVLYDIVSKNSELFKEELKQIKATHREVFVNINPIYINKIINSNISLSLLPMVATPKNIDNNGDYYPYYISNTNVLALDECNVIKGKYDQRFNSKGSEEFYEGINYMNKVKFKINKPMLSLIFNEWENENSFLFNGQNKYKEILENDSKEIKKEKIIHNSKYSLYYNIINIAYLFRNQSFYLPVYADFRGRIYTLSNYLSYQGNDLARSLLIFDSNEILNKKGYEALNVYLSNLAGYDKLSWNDRLEKSMLVTEEFCDAGYNYFNNTSKELMVNLIKNLSEPFQYISINLAKLEYLQKGKDTIISNPILFDASCSGIQHISALTMDKELARFTNVITEKENPSNELPEDFYSYALTLVNNKLKLSENHNINNIQLTRKIIKKSIMTIPYNISLSGIGEQLEEFFKKMWILNKYEYVVPEEVSITKNSYTITSKEYGLLISTIYKVLKNDIPSLDNLTKYFEKIISVLNKINMPITWETPAGLKIKYQQILFESKKIRNRIIKTSNPITISVPTNKIDKQKMLRSFMPNYIHSLDATNVHLLFKDLSKNKNIPIYTVHDCFASTPNNIELIEQKVKEAFIEIYFKEEGYLLKCHEKIINQIKESYEIFIENNKECIEIYSNKNEKDYLELPEFPKAFMNKNWNDFIKGLLKSKYFIG